jgi:hypothetical protein
MPYTVIVNIKCRCGQDIKCRCGCGQDVTEPMNYVFGHQSPYAEALDKHRNGYVIIRGCWGHPRSDVYGYVYEHILKMEEKIDRYLFSWGKCTSYQWYKDR